MIWVGKGVLKVGSGRKGQTIGYGEEIPPSVKKVVLERLIANGDAVDHTAQKPGKNDDATKKIIKELRDALSAKEKEVTDLKQTVGDLGRKVSSLENELRTAENKLAEKDEAGKSKGDNKKTGNKKKDKADNEAGGEAGAETGAESGDKSGVGGDIDGGAGPKA